MKPRNAKTYNQILQLRVDGWSNKEHWLQLDVDHITIQNQKMGQESTGRVKLPRRVFNAMVSWYLREQSRPSSRQAGRRKR